MMTHLQTLTHRLAIEESQQRQIDPVQDDSKFLDQMAETQVSTNVNTTVADNQSPLPSPVLSTPYSSLSPSTSTSASAALSSPADTPKTALVQSPITSITKSPTPNSTTPTTTTNTSTKKPPATPGGTKKLLAQTKTTKSSSKPIKQSQKDSIQSCPSPKVQLRLDSFLVSKKPSLASATKRAVDSETKTPGKSNLKHAANASSNTSNQPPPALKTPTIAVKSTSATTSSTTPPKPKSRVRVRVRTKPARTPPSTNTTKPTEPTTSSPVEKRTITLYTISKTPPSPPKPRLKANIFFGLLPPPTVTTANRKEDETLRREGDPNTSASMSTNTVEKHKNAPKAEPDTLTTPPLADTNVATAKLTKVKGFVGNSNDPDLTSSTTATGKDMSPTEVVTSRVVKSKYAMSQLKSTTAPAVKTGPDKPVVPAESKCTTTPPLVTNRKSVPVEISSRVIKIKSSTPEAKSRPTTATPTSTTTPAVTAMATSETASLKTVLKPTKVSCTSKNAMTATAVCKTKTLPSLISQSVIASAERSKKSSNTAPLSWTKITAATTTAVVVVPKTKATSKGASITSKSSSKESSVPKTPKLSSTTTIATTTSVSKDSSAVPKPSKNFTISTSAPKNNNKDKLKDKDSLRTTSEITAATRPAAQTFNPIPPQQPQQLPPTPPLQPLATATTSISSILPSPISPSWPNEDMPMDSPAFSPTTSTQTPRRTNFAFNTSPSGIVLSLSTNHNYLQTQNRQFATLITATGITATTSCQRAPAPALHPPLGRTTPPPPRPKRVLELMLQSDHENDSPYYYYLRRSQRNPSTSKNDITSSSSNPRPQKRQRLADISAESTAGRNHGMFGQTAFEQALDAMSFKYPTPARRVPGPATASQRLRLFQKRRREASTSTMAVGRRVVGGGGAPRWIP